MSTPTPLGRAVAKALADAGMTQTQLADATGIAQPSLSAMLAGRRTVTGESLIRMHDAMTGGDARKSLTQAIKTRAPVAPCKK